jgi:hypothetical protein
MNLIRSLMTVFLACVMAVAVAGWVWVGDLPSPKLEAARCVLGLCMAMAVGSVALLWTARESEIMK